MTEILDPQEGEVICDPTCGSGGFLIKAFEYVREKTLTCYNGIIGDGCGECPSCKLRQNGLETYLKQKEELNN